jgi:hypothetical protein
MSIAFTLQTGRVPMEERLGFIVHSLHELEEKLNPSVYDCFHIIIRRKYGKHPFVFFRAVTVQSGAVYILSCLSFG